MADVRLLTGDCLEVMRGLPDASVNACVTSPPYYGLRDYGIDGQVGLEKTPADYVARLVEVFREVRRVLRDDGTLWLNLGDSFNSSPSNQHSSNVGANGSKALGETVGRQKREIPGLKPKDLIGIPWRVAFALQADGWWLRSEIIWAKPNPMPESVRDRPTKAHEQVFLLAKAERYYFDADAVREPLSEWSEKALVSTWKRSATNKNAPDRNDGPRVAEGVSYASRVNPAGRNVRSVWSIATRAYKGAHFATMPPELARRCIKAGCPEGGTVLDPFGGAGTTARVALELGRDAIGIDLNPAYNALAEDRCAEVRDKAPLFAAGA